MLGKLVGVSAMAVLPLTAGAQDAASPAQIDLLRGYYLTGVMSCDEASNATLGLFHNDGFNPGHRSDCEFTSIRWTGPTTFDYVEYCRDPFGENGGGIELSGSIEIFDIRSFRRFAPTGESDWYHCPQEYLPDPWRTTDLPALID